MNRERVRVFPFALVVPGGKCLPIAAHEFLHGVEPNLFSVHDDVHKSHRDFGSKAGGVTLAISADAV